jgi:hypothetical protein
MDKYQVEAVFCKDAEKCEDSHISGTWSTVYDQSFKVELDNGLRFLANFKYSIKKEISVLPVVDGEKKFEDVKTGDYGKFDSQCDKTMIGFVQTIPTIAKDIYTMNKHKIVCFYGEQDTHYDMEKTVSVKTESDTVKVAVITSQNKIISEPIEKTQTLAQVRSSKKRFNAHHAH